MTVSATFDVPTVMALAGPGAYARGAVYWSDGRVELGEITDDRVRAVVRASMPYTVESSPTQMSRAGSAHARLLRMGRSASTA